MEEAPTKTPPAGERMANALSEDDSAPTKSIIDRAGESYKSVGSPRRNGIPPKRPLTTSQRTTTPTPSSATKSTATSASRTAQGSALSKPPTRPLANSSGRRPLNGVNPTNSMNSTHKPRHSTSSVEDAKRDPVLSEGENKKSAVSAPAKRTSMASTTAARASAPKISVPNSARRSTVGSSTSLESKAPTRTDSNASPTKFGPKATISNARTLGVSSTPRTSRPPPSSSKRVPGMTTSDQTKKRLSTIPASPAHPVSESEADRSAEDSRTLGIPARPGLGTRKSTMSVAIEQRLREMELVNQMLKAAMTEEGDEEDEVKEEYGKRMDENLASLRSKLEEARRNEGKVPIKGSESKVDIDYKDEPLATKHTNDDRDQANDAEIEKLRTALSTSEEKTSTLELELEALKTKVADLQDSAEKVSADAQQKIENIRREHAEEMDRLSTTNTREVDALRTTMTEAETQQKQFVDNIRQEQEEKTKELSVAHKTEMKALHTKLIETEARQKQIAEDAHKEQEQRIDEMSTIHRTELEALRAELAESRKEQTRLLEKSTKDLEKAKSVASEQSSKEIATLRCQIRDEKDASTERTKEAEKAFEDKLQEILTSQHAREEEYSSSKGELQEIQLAHTRALEEARSASSKQISELENATANLKGRVVEMESKSKADKASHARLLQGKDLEIADLGSVIGKLQDKIEHLHATKESELASVKFESNQEHTAVLSKLGALHKSEINQVREEALEKMSSTRENHDHEIEQLHQEHQKFQNRTDKTFSELQRSKDDMQKFLSTLEGEKNAAVSSREELEKSLKDASSEVSTLKAMLETYDKGKEEKDQQYALEIKKIQDELESTLKILAEKSKEGLSIVDSHAKELQALREANAEEIATLSANHTQKSDKAMKELQNNYYELLEVWKEAEQSHPMALEAMKAEHLNAIEQAQASHDEEMRAIKDRLESKYSKEKRETEIESARNIIIEEERHLKEIEEIKKQHEASASAQEKAYQAELSALQGQAIQSRKDLADREHELQATREELSVSHQSDQDASELRFKELQAQLTQSQSEIAAIKPELDMLRQEKTDADALKDQYSAKENEMQSLLARDKARIEELVAEMEKINRNELDDSEADVLRKEVAELKNIHTIEMVKIQEALSIENETLKKERKTYAEAIETFTDEISKLEHARTELLIAKQEAESHREKAMLVKQEMQTLQLQLEQAHLASQDHKAREHDLLAQLDVLQTEIDVLKKNSLSSKARRRSSSMHSQELSASQTMVDSEHEDRDKLKKQLEIEIENAGKLKEQLAHALADVEKLAMKKRELEAALKVTTAQLTEEQTKREDGRHFTTSPTPRTPLRTSRWPSTNEVQEGGDVDNEVLEGEDMGSLIQGSMAKIQVQMKQIGDSNEDLLDKHERMIHKISKATSRTIESEESLRPLLHVTGD